MNPRNALQTAKQIGPRTNKARSMLEQAKRSGITPKPVSPAIKQAVQNMVFLGNRREAAAEAAGVSDDYFRQQLTRIEVLSYMDEQKEVLRRSAGAEGLHVVREIMHKDEATDRDRIRAFETIERLGTERNQGVTVNVQTNVVTAGYVMDLREDEPKSAPQIEHLDDISVKSLISIEDIQG